MIKNVLIVGLGAVGSLYASKITDAKILVDKERLEKYKKTPTFINGVEHKFNYIVPETTFTPDAFTTHAFTPDLIIISAKFYNLEEILKNIKNFVKPNTIILSLMNGITSEDIIKDRYPQANVIKSYLICNSIIRNNREITHDGINKIIHDKNTELTEFFNKHNINHEESADIKSDMWQKYLLNISANQLSAVTGMTFGEMNNLPYIERLLRNILEEVVFIAKVEGVKVDIEKTISTFKNMAPYGKTSMLQDIEQGNRTEIDAFAGTIINLGKKHNIQTPYNTLFKWLFSVSRESN